MPFKDWIKKIEPFLQAGDTFKRKAEEEVAFESYLCLPDFWHAMSPEEKQAAVDIVAYSDTPWGVDCTKLLRDTCKVLLLQVSQLFSCIIVAAENPSHIQ